MKKRHKAVALWLGLLPTFSAAQEVDLEKYPDYTPCHLKDYSLMVDAATPSVQGTTVLPEQVNNINKFLPPFFSQTGSSCGSASRVGYMFTYEMNALRGTDASKLENRYPTHFTWLLTAGNSNKNDIMQNVGMPNAEEYGGITYSTVFGVQDCKSNEFGWMQGYEKWYSAMFNRMTEAVEFPQDLGTSEGRTALKRWLYNHNGDADFHAGGVAGIGVGAAAGFAPIASTPANDETGTVGKKYITHWGPAKNHALTIVGYDDRIEFDLDGNGVYGETDKDEKGAWIVVNSWGENWANGGWTYCPYFNGRYTFKQDLTDPQKPVYTPGTWWTAEVLKVRKNYRPLRTLRVRMDYSHRSEIALSVGISTDLQASAPEMTIPLHHFQYAGDGNHGNTQPAPAVPMLGRWADGVLHQEPMEFGYDLTDLSAHFNKNQPLKYFFIVEAKDWAEGQGKIYNASIIDYDYDRNGVETPFTVDTQNGTAVRTVDVNGKTNGKTLLTTVVYGEKIEDSYNAPQNLCLDNTKLTWTAPAANSHIPTGYHVYGDGILLGTAPTTTYTVNNGKNYQLYEVEAVYEGNMTSQKVSVSGHLVAQNPNQVIKFDATNPQALSGFRIPKVFDKKYNEATIEFWFNPTDITKSSNNIGPGWKNFLLYHNKQGQLIIGWAEDEKSGTGKKPTITSQNRYKTAKYTIENNTWTHIAVTVSGNQMSVYLNGKLATNGSFTSNTYSGIGGFGNFDFYAPGEESAMHCQIDEVRIWDVARTAEQIKGNYQAQFYGAVRPSHLLAYYNGNVISANGKNYLYDAIGGYHAEIINNHELVDESKILTGKPTPTALSSVTIENHNANLIAGNPYPFSAVAVGDIESLTWSATNSNVQHTKVLAPQITFNAAGTQTITVNALGADGKTKKTATLKVEVAAAPTVTLNADFAPTKSPVPLGESVTFHVKQPLRGHTYTWTMPGAKVETSHQMNATALYPAVGTYTVTLKVTAPNGKSATASQEVKVEKIAPISVFDITPGIIVLGEKTLLQDHSKNLPNLWKWHLSNSNGYDVITGQNTSYTPTQTGVYDVMLYTENEAGSHQQTRPRGLMVCNADSKTGLNFHSDKEYVQLAKNPWGGGCNQATIEWWMAPDHKAKEYAGIGEDGSFFMYCNNYGKVFVNIGTKAVTSTPGFILVGQWHHYAVTFNQGQVNFYRDGILRGSAKAAVKTIPNLTTFCIGKETTQPFNGQIDEFRIWNQARNIDQIRAYANSPITNIAAEEKNGLVLYYDFNQGSGDVVDATSNKNTGTRMNFGPDGDAWGLSQGVFSLNFNDASTDVTSTYLKNYGPTFTHTSKKINNKKNLFWISDWTEENNTDANSNKVGVHINTSKGSCFGFISGKDKTTDTGFTGTTNHKVYQTLTLPAGKYRFIAYYDETQPGDPFNSYLVAAEGTGLPNTENIATALASSPMEIKEETMSNTLSFTLPTEKNISLGLLINQNQKNGIKECYINHFQLTRIEPTEQKADGAENYEMTVKEGGFYTLYLTYDAKMPEGVTAYAATAVEGHNLKLTPVAQAGEILAKETPVVLDILYPESQPSTTYIFEYATLPGKTAGVNLLKGSSVDTYVAPTPGCTPYVMGVRNGIVQMLKAKLNLNENGQPGTTHFRNRAHKAWLEVPKNENQPMQTLQFHKSDETTGIEQFETDSPLRIYDLQGRAVKQPLVPGLYIINGHKQVIK